MPWIELGSAIEDADRGFEYTTVVKFVVVPRDAGDDVTPVSRETVDLLDARVLVAEWYDPADDELRTVRGDAARRHDDRVHELITADDGLREAIEEYCLRNEDLADAHWIDERPSPRMAASRRERVGGVSDEEEGVA